MNAIGNRTLGNLTFEALVQALLRLVIVILITTPSLVSAETVGVNTLVVVSDDKGVYQEIVQGLQSHASVDPENMPVVVLADAVNLQYLLLQSETIVTLGTHAADRVFHYAPSARVLSALITESGFTYLAIKHYQSLENALEHGVSAVFLDQPIERLYQLGALLLPEARRIGVLTSDIATAENSVRNFSPDTDKGVLLQYVTVGASSSPINVLNPIIKNSDFVIALPGKKATTVSAAKWILKIGSQSRTPVIAFSKKYAKSGALASVYTSPENVVEDIVHIISLHGLAQANSALVYFPHSFSVEINYTVADILNVQVREDDYYHRTISQAEGQR
ncbi:MAG: ABC transporter substrate binding protein [Halioglobus sp.]